MDTPALPKILCVEDDADSCEVLQLMLRMHQFEGKCASSGAQALQLVQSESFDMYLLDGWLPDFDGFELCRRLRALQPGKPILFYSGGAHESDAAKGIAAGANAYIVKPDFAGLIEAISNFASTPLGPAC